FLAIIYCSNQVREVRDDVSRTYAAQEQGETAVGLAKSAQERGSPGAAETLQQAQADLKAKTVEFDAAKAVSDRWKDRARYAGILLRAMLLVDAFLPPGLVRRRIAVESAQRTAGGVHVDTSLVHEGGVGEDPTLNVHTRFTDAIDALSTSVGEFVAWWAM